MAEESRGMLMLTTIMPFACLGTGLLIGLQSLPRVAYKVVDRVTTISLVILMITIGGNVGTNEEVIAEIGVVGINCVVTCLCAIAGSILLCLLIEKTIVPLKQYSQMQLDDESDGAAAEPDVKIKKRVDPILIIIPISVIIGALGCYFFLPNHMTFLLEYALWSSLVVLYISVGIGMGNNKSVFKYIKTVGFKILYFVLGIYLGSMAGGAVAALITGMPLNYAVVAASGVGYYSMTGATMLSTFGAEAGIYGFMINVFRDFFTILLLPVLAIVSKSAPIASGGAGNMDSMLVPITRVLGKELGLITLIVGITLTFGVPVILPILCSVLG